MSRITERKRLIKLLGKELRYEGTYSRISEYGGSVMLIDIKYNGKIVSDHIWVASCNELNKTVEGETFTFLATASSYKDKNGKRKYGLKKCYRYHFGGDVVAKAKDDCRNKFKRLHK